MGTEIIELENDLPSCISSNSAFAIAHVRSVIKCFLWLITPFESQITWMQGAMKGKEQTQMTSFKPAFLSRIFHMRLHIGLISVNLKYSWSHERGRKSNFPARHSMLQKKIFSFYRFMYEYNAVIGFCFERFCIYFNGQGPTRTDPYEWFWLTTVETPQTLKIG